MRRKFLSLAYATLLAGSLGACNQTTASVTARSEISSILANPANITPTQIQAALQAVDPALAAKIESVGTQASTYITAACGIAPIASSLVSIAAAFYSTAGVLVTPMELATTFCKAYNAATTPKLAASRRVRGAWAPLQPGQVVRRTVDVNGISVVAAGTVINPALVK